MPAAVRIRLLASERRMLFREQQRAKSPRVWKRIAAVLMLATGATAAAVMEALSISRRTLTNWKRRWLARQESGLEDRQRSGRPPRASTSYVKAMVRAVRQDPRRLGYAFARWTAPRLAQYLWEVTGVRLTPHWLSELLRMHGFVWRRTKRTIRNLQNPAATKRAQKALKRLKKGLSIPTRTTNSGSRTAYGSNCSLSSRTRTASGDVR